MTTVDLHDISGGNLAAFNGADVSGDWILEVRDVRKKKTGVLTDWQITVQSAPAAAAGNTR
jgi:subtilisin-like proprotein convertase family protein